MMNIQFKSLNYLDYEKKSQTFQIEAPKTITEVLIDEGIELNTIKSATFFVNGTHQRSDYMVRDGDVITVIPVVVGG